MTLRGTCPAKCDEKGRPKIPAVFLEALREYGSQFYITSPTGESARIYPMKVWSGIEDKLGQVASQNRAHAQFSPRDRAMLRAQESMSARLAGPGEIPAAAATAYLAAVRRYFTAFER